MTIKTEQKGNIGLFAKLDHRSIIWFARKSASFNDSLPKKGHGRANLGDEEISKGTNAWEGGYLGMTPRWRCQLCKGRECEGKGKHAGLRTWEGMKTCVFYSAPGTILCK
jgi:hypothetical protein